MFYAKPKIVYIRGCWYAFWRGGVGRGATPTLAGRALGVRAMIFLALILLFGCAENKLRPVFVPQRVEVPRYIRAPLPPEFVQDRIVAEPDPACWIDTQRAFCNSQIAQLINDYRAALRQSNIDKAALRACCNAEDKPP